MANGFMPFCAFRHERNGYKHENTKGDVQGESAPQVGKPLPLSTVAELLEVNRTSVYYVPKKPSELEIKAKHRIDEIHTESPSWGSRQISKTLKKQGINIGRLKTRHYMTEMGIEAIYPKPNLSKSAKGHKIYPYLLRNAVITRANQAWSIDITYIIKY